MQSVIINGVRSTTVDLSIGVPQGSVLGPLLLLTHVSLLRSVIQRHPEVRHHGYADDRHLYTHTPSSTYETRTTTGGRYSGWRCVWRRSGSGCSPTSSNQQRQDGVYGHHDSTLPDHLPSAAAGCECWWHQRYAVSSLHNLGVIMDSTIDMHSQIQSVKCAMFHHLRTISNIRRFLDRDTCVKAVMSLVVSRVDYCNSFLVGQSALQVLQLAQNYAARLMMGLRRCDHVTSVLGGAALATDPPVSLLQTGVLPLQDPVHRRCTSLHELHGQPVYVRQGTALCQCHYIWAWLYLEPVWHAQAAASRCRLMVSGMRCLLTSVTVGHSGLLKLLLKLIHSGNILVKHHCPHCWTLLTFKLILKLLY